MRGLVRWTTLLAATLRGKQKAIWSPKRGGRKTLGKGRVWRNPNKIAYRKGGAIRGEVGRGGGTNVQMGVGGGFGGVMEGER